MDQPSGPTKFLKLAKYTRFFNNLLQRQVCSRCILRINHSLDLEMYRNKVETG